MTALMDPNTNQNTIFGSLRQTMFIVRKEDATKIEKSEENILLTIVSLYGHLSA